jgi:hypothetical protein
MCIATSWRASSIGVYRLWRDLGYDVDALLAGIIADALGLRAAMWAVTALTFGTGALVAVRMKEALRITAAPTGAPVVVEQPRGPLGQRDV